MTDEIRRAESQRVAGLLTERTGEHVRSVYDLVNRRERYPNAIPILVEVLPTVNDPITREGIVRALATPDARGVASAALFRELDRTEGWYFRWVVANTLSEIATAADAQELILLAATESDSRIRQMLARALGRAGQPAAVPVLVDLLDDPVASGQAARALGRIGSSPSEAGLAKLRELALSGDRDQRAAATSALRRLAPDPADPSHQ